MSGLSCVCGHEARWHGDLGCGYLGWNYGSPRCGCRLSDGVVVQQIADAAVRAALEAAAVAVEEFDASDDYHQHDHYEPSYYSALDRAILLLRGGITSWLDAKPAAIPQPSQPPEDRP